MTNGDDAIEVQRRRAMEYLAEEQVEPALVLFEEILAARPDKALELDPDHVTALLQKGMKEADAGRPEEALELFERALAVAPDEANAWFLKGCVLRDLERHEQADACMQKAREISPGIFGPVG
jgi:tetratricopeptide (TPR) repeat protein